MNRLSLPIAFASTCLIAACATTPADPLLMPPDAAMIPGAAADAPAAVAPPPIPARNPALSAFFEEVDKAGLARLPMSKSYRGIKDADYGKLDDNSDAAAVAQRVFGRQFAADLQRRFPRDTLSHDDQLSYDLYLAQNARQEAIFAYRRQGYVFDQMNGVQSQAPAFLINIHRVDSVADAEAYVSRLSGLAAYLDRAIAESGARQQLGALPPKWVFPYVIADSRNVISGAPFGPGEDSALWADFKAKAGKLQADEATKSRLLASARAALLDDVRPAYRRVISLMESQQKVAPTDDGIWRFGNGAQQYKALLGFYTTTDLDGDQIHALGLRQVGRIHAEMAALKDRVGFKGGLPQFFAHMRTSKQFYYPNTPAGRQMYLDETQKALALVQPKLPQFFGRLPKAPMVVKAVEPFREKSAGKAFYQAPAPDGSRPGTYYVNLYDMNDMPSTEVEALFCHEGIPGHHLQRAIQTELGDVPPFRRFGGVTTYSEGWGLYAEKLCTEMGAYTDPYRDFGRLQLELHRAIRLVVDSGLHHKRWTRETAIKYVEDNSADAPGGIVKAIERYIVNPGQATAYMVGKLKIEELRAKAEAALGPKFDIRGFHDTLLLSGPVPLDVLEQRVDAWVAGVR